MVVMMEPGQEGFSAFVGVMIGFDVSPFA